MSLARTVKTYPIMLNVRGRLAVVVGGGAVGVRRARSLVEAGAEVHLISDDTAETADLEGVNVVRASYRPELLKGASLVLACTDDRELNARIASDGRRVGALVNVADEPEHCDFFLPAVASDGEVVIAVGTGGSAPGLAARLRDHLSNSLPERTGELAAVLGKLRSRVKSEVIGVERRAEIMKQLTEETAYKAFLNGGENALVEMLEDLL
jgi:siroheme synthase-like protein